MGMFSRPEMDQTNCSEGIFEIMTLFVTILFFLLLRIIVMMDFFHSGISNRVR